jgi:uncharacterized protein (DUF302 family)
MIGFGGLSFLFLVVVMVLLVKVLFPPDGMDEVPNTGTAAPDGDPSAAGHRYGAGERINQAQRRRSVTFRQVTEQEVEQVATYSMQARLKGTYDEVKVKVVEALKEQGFGILTEIDVRKTLKEKTGANFERYEILGACNPQLAHRALETDRAIGLLLPCNVVLREVGSEVEVSVLDPERMFELADESSKAALSALAGEAKKRLEAALSVLKGGLR